MRSIKVESDGRIYNALITDSQTGKVIEGITKLVLTFDGGGGGGLVEANLSSIDVESEVEFMIDHKPSKEAQGIINKIHNEAEMAKLGEGRIF